MQRINHHSKKERKAGFGEKDEGRKMIAVLIALNIRLPNELTILDIEGKVHRLKTQIDMLAFCFKCLFAPDGIGNFTQHHATLRHPMSAMEVQSASIRIDALLTLI